MALSLISVGAMGVIALYQMGVIKHLPEPPLPKLNADRVDSSPEAYSRLATPDAALGLCNYAATAAFAAAGGKGRARTRPWLPAIFGAKLLFDVAQAARMVRQQWMKEKSFSFWGLLAATASITAAIVGLAEIRAAARGLFTKRH